MAKRPTPSASVLRSCTEHRLHEQARGAMHPGLFAYGYPADQEVVDRSLETDELAVSRDLPTHVVESLHLEKILRDG